MNIFLDCSVEEGDGVVCVYLLFNDNNTRTNTNYR